MDMIRGERMKARYKVHRFNIKMTSDQSKLEQFLNSLDGEVVAIIPNVNPKFARALGPHQRLEQKLE